MVRPIPEWIGKHHGVNIPPRVRLRVFDAHGGICYLCRLPIKPAESWQVDHVTALVNGGEHREKNLAPAHSHCHVAKSALDVAEKAKVAKVRAKHVGAIRAKQTIQSRGFDKVARTPKPSLPPRQMYARGELCPAGRNSDAD